MLDERIPARLDVDAPRLIVVVDTEEAFDWTGPYRRSTADVRHIRQQGRAQAIYDRYRLKPTYLIDYPVASQEEGYRPIKEWLDDGLCDVGSHLHPWVNPPFEEELTVANTYAGNLVPALEREKLKRLTGAIERNLAHRPILYRAGRYGIGPATAEILEDLGYQVDLSVVPCTTLADDGGPDFRNFSPEPFWFGPSNNLLEIPLTVAWCGLIKPTAGAFQSLLTNTLATKLHVPGFFARTGLLERIRLTPEGITIAEIKRLTKSLLEDKNRIFCLSYHSPSLVPGNTPYVRDESDLARFLHVIEEYCDFLLSECGGIASTPSELHRICKNSREETRVRSILSDC